jgi:peptide/nickel transport system permease protein
MPKARSIIEGLFSFAADAAGAVGKGFKGSDLDAPSRTGVSGSGASRGDMSIYYASQGQLMWRKFQKHKLAMAGAVVVILLYLVAIFADFLSPYDPNEFDKNRSYAQPSRLHFIREDGSFNLRPFVYGRIRTVDKETYERVYTEDTSRSYPVRFFVTGYTYRLFGFIPATRHLFGAGEGRVFLFGTDKLGRDVFSKIMHGARISMSIGLVGVAISFVLGLLLGGISGFYGGKVDLLIQRLIEILRSFPSIPLWMTLSAAFPPDWSAITVYFMITVILSVIGWTSLARVVRGRILSLKEENYAEAAMLAGAKDLYIIRRHLIPGFMSHIIASLTLRIPAMILAETALSFLGIGLRPPVISWGVLLQEAQNVSSIAMHPWLFAPAAFIIAAVLAFNFFGDGLRDAADPYT